MDRYGHLFPSAEQTLCAGLDAAYERQHGPAEATAENVVPLR